MFRWLDKMLDRILVVLGALIFLQAPLFMQQYHLSLQGHVKEIEYQIDKITQAAQKSGKTLTEWIQKFRTSSDHDFVLQGELMNDMVVRREELNDSMQAWRKANIFERPFVFIRHFQTDIVKDTWHLFQFGIPFNAEGAAYGLFGIAFGYVLYCVMSMTFRLFFGLFRLPFKRKGQEIQKGAG